MRLPYCGIAGHPYGPHGATLLSAWDETVTAPAPPTECPACAAYDREEVTTDPFKWLGLEGHHHALIAEKDARIRELEAMLDYARLAARTLSVSAEAEISTLKESAFHASERAAKAEAKLGEARKWAFAYLNHIQQTESDRSLWAMEPTPKWGFILELAKAAEARWSGHDWESAEALLARERGT